MASAFKVPTDATERTLALGMRGAALHFGVCVKTIRKWTGIVATEARKCTFRPMPADFAEQFVTSTLTGLEAHYTAGNTTVMRWRNELPEAVREARRAVVTATRKKTQAEIERVRRAERVANQLPPTPPRMKSRYKPGGWQKLPDIQIPMDVSSRAIRYLQPHYLGVYRAEIVAGRAGVGLFRIGHITTDATGLLAIAAKHGFEPDAWRAVA